MTSGVEVIQRNTVLVLGAGASKPYGYPLGGELVDELHRGLSKENAQLFQLLVQCGQSPGRIVAFRNALIGSGRMSVDRFLERRQDFVEVGKLAIAALLVRLEVLPLRPEKGNWYPYLWERLDPSVEDGWKGNVSIVTFNYDRSIDQFLFDAFKNTFGLEDQVASRLLRTIPTVHVNGKLGELPHEDGLNGRPYRVPDGSEWAAAAMEGAKGIKIVSEGAIGSAEIAQARGLIERADVVCFLGFGYLSENLERLGIRSRMHDPILWGSAFGLRHDETQRVKALFAVPSRPMRDLVLGSSTEDVLECLRTYAMLA